MTSGFYDIHALHEETNSIESMQKYIENMQRERFLLSVLRRDGLTAYDIEDECRGLNINWNTNYFALMIAKIVSWEQSFYDGNSVMSEKVRRFIRFLVLNVTEELLGDDFKVISVVIDGNYCCVMNLMNTGQDVEKALHESAETIEKTLADNCSVVVQLDASAVVKGMPALADAYEQLKNVEKYRLLFQNDDNLLTYSNISKDEVKQINFFEDEPDIFNLVRLGDYGRVSEELNKIIDNICASEVCYHTAQFLFTRMQSSVRSLINYSSEHFGSKEFWHELDAPRLITSAVSFTDLKDVICSLFERIGNYDNEIPKWYPQLLTLVQSECNNPNTNVNTLADRLGITATHLSRTFRKLRGIGLPDYIHILRITEAKRLLADGKSIKAVMELVGYVDQLTMSRAFKKYEGYTPAQYASLK